MKLFSFINEHFLLRCCVIIQVFSVVYATRESYEGFSGENGILDPNPNSESTESSYESNEPLESPTEEKHFFVNPSKSVPSHSTFFVTATRYGNPEYASTTTPEAFQDFSVTPSQQFSSEQEKFQPNFSSEDDQQESEIPPSSMESTTSTFLTTSSKPTTQGTSLTMAEKISQVAPTGNGIEEDEENVQETPTVPSKEEEKAAELVKEPIPTPMALISSNGEGSNPPLEEEFAEAFPKVGPNGRRRRIRPGGGGGGGRGRRVRMRVRKLRTGSGETFPDDNINGNNNNNDIDDSSNPTHPTMRPRRYRSTTTAVPPSQDPQISSSSSPQTVASKAASVIKSGPKPIIVSDIHSGSTGVINSQEPQLEKPASGGFTEQISTYFFTQPPKISTTVSPNSEGSSTESSSEDIKALESQIHSSSSYALQSHPWDRTEKSNTEMQMGESERNSLNTNYLMDDRAYNSQPPFGMDYDSNYAPSHSHSTNPITNPGLGNYNKINENGQEMNDPMSQSYFPNAPNVGFDSVPFTQANTGRSHYDRNKDPFFTRNQIFQNNNPFPNQGQTPGGINDNDPRQFSPPGIENSQSNEHSIIPSDQGQLPVFDHNGYVATLPPTGDQYFQHYGPEDQNNMNTPPNDYGKSTHYTTDSFKSSPVDPVGTRKKYKKSKAKKEQQQIITESDFDHSGAITSSEPSQYHDQQQIYTGNNNLNDIDSDGGYLGQPPYDAIPPPPQALHQYHYQGNQEDGNHNNENMQDNPQNYIPEYSTATNGPLTENVTIKDSNNDPMKNDLTQNTPQNFEGSELMSPPNNNNNMNDINDINNINNNNLHSHLPHNYPAFTPIPSQDASKGQFPLNRPPLGPLMLHRPPPNHFFRNSGPPMPPLHLMQHPPRLLNHRPQQNNAPFGLASPSEFGNPSISFLHGRPPPDFHNSSPHVNLPMPGLNNIPPPPSEHQALNEVQPLHHFPPHTHSMSDKPDYEPANPPLPPGHPMEVNFGNYGGDFSNHIDEEHHHQAPNFHDFNNDHDHHHHNSFDKLPGNQPTDGDNGSPNNRPNGPGFDILSAYYDKPPPTVGSEHAQHQQQHNSGDNQLSKVPFQYSSSDGGGLDNGFVPNSQNNGENSDSSSKEKGKNTEEKNLTAMFSETPYVLMFPQLVPEEAMIPPPPKLMTKEIPVVQASSLSAMQFTPDGKPVLGPGLKAVPVHPRHQMYQVLAKAHYDKALQKYLETRKKPPSAIYTPYGILVPMGPSTAASTNHEKFARMENKQHVQAAQQDGSKDPQEEKQMLHLLLGNKGRFGHFHFFKTAALQNGRLKKHLDFKANVDPALDLLAEKLAIKLSAAKYLLSAPAKFGLKAFSKQHTASYSEHKPVVQRHPHDEREEGRGFANSFALAPELKDLLSTTHPTYATKQVKGEEIDPEFKYELKNMLKERLKEILEETERAEAEKEQLSAMAAASSVVNTRIQFPKSRDSKDSNKWSNYFSSPSISSISSNSGGGLLGTIKRLFFGSNRESEKSESDWDIGEVSHPFGSSSMNNLFNSVGRMGLLPSSDTSSPFSQNINNKGSSLGTQRKVKKQLEKWLDIVLRTSDIGSSSNSVRYPGITRRSDDFLDGNMKTSLSNIYPSSSRWTPVVSSAFRSVFNNYPSDKSSSYKGPTTLKQRVT